MTARIATIDKKNAKVLKKIIDKWGWPKNVAYLTDRVAVNEKRPQKFGTQGDLNASGCWEPVTLEDAHRVDNWRAQYGLEPLDHYKRLVNEYSGHPECNRK